MRELGLIGGMSRLSTRTDYDHNNQSLQAKVGLLRPEVKFVETLDRIHAEAAVEWFLAD